MGVTIWLVTILILVSFAAATVCNRCLHQSKVAIFPDHTDFSKGACRYGADTTEFNGGNLAAAAPSIYNDGAGCGASYQVRCTDKKICLKQGITVIVTDKSEISNTDFVLSKAAVNNLFKNNYTTLKTVDVEYKRVPSKYAENEPMKIRVESIDKNYLAIKILYQGGQTDISSIDIAAARDSNKWHPMERKNGAIWQVNTLPTGRLQFQFKVKKWYGKTGFYVSQKNILPSNLKLRGVYGLGIQLVDIAQEICKTCENTNWG